MADNDDMSQPSFRAYLRVMRHKPGFGFAVCACVCAMTRETLAEGPLAAVVCFVLGAAIGAACFPWWRRQAAKEPILYSYNQPELLVDGTSLGAHPCEPMSNVRLEAHDD